MPANAAPRLLLHGGANMGVPGVESRRNDSALLFYVSNDDSRRMPGLPSLADGQGGRHHHEMPVQMIPRSEKAVAYIVRGRTVAVFLHEGDANPVRESGLQVPAGTCETGETPENAVLREAYEETGLVGLRIVRRLGEADYDMRPYADVVHHRHFFHLAVDGPIVEEWRHVECDGGTGKPKPYLFFWLPIAQAHVLAAGLGAMLGRIGAAES